MLGYFRYFVTSIEENMKDFYFLILLICFIAPSQIHAQVEKQASSAEIYEALMKLNNTATVMYVAAHPDDENTRLISWLSNHMRVNTVYLSLTRGDGGQNLIGAEKGQMLGLLRTQELLQARKIDGGQQFFTRANDFGYSKTATETRSIWEEEEIMHDVVWAIRKYQPDILINRFDHNSNGRTHGHHTFSAIASLEAFELSGNPNMFPEQLEFVDSWQPKRVFFNTSWWFYGSRENFAKADKSKMVAVDVGEYYPIRGISNNEIAAQSRSMHKCQAFGTAATRGSQLEYLEFLKGDAPAMSDGAMNDIFDGIDMSWNRIPNGGPIDKSISKLINDFQFSNPSASLKGLMELRQIIHSTEMERPLKDRKLDEIRQIIRWCASLYIDATTSVETATNLDSIEIQIECINRSKGDIKLKTVSLLPNDIDLAVKSDLNFNQAIKLNKKIIIPDHVSYSTAYWLKDKQKNIGMYHVPNREQIGQAESQPALSVKFEFDIAGYSFSTREPIQYKYTDPAMGEVYQPFVISPPVTVTLPEPVYLLANGQPADIVVEVLSHTADIKGQVMLDIEEGWTVTPPIHEFNIGQKGKRLTYTFQVQPPDNEIVTSVKGLARVNDKEYNLSYTAINYDHIPKQTAFISSEAILEHIKINIPNMRVGYIAGSGDVIPQSLEQLGMVVEEINIKSTNLAELKQYQSIIIGIRAFNTRNEIAFLVDDLWQYVEEGGNLVVQYNTTRRLKSEVAPLPLTLTRDRIAEEKASLTMLDPTHPIFNYPNKITTDDFGNWVQERGLYFAGEWDEAFTPLLSGHDTGEEDKKGILLAAQYGKGYYVYTGLSFFRQLPAGVPGAYRLFVNLLSLQHDRP